MDKRLAQYNFTPEEIEMFRSNGLVIKCPKKMVLLHEGETPRFFYWVLSGIYRSGFIDKKGNEHTRNFFSADTLPYAVQYGSFATQRPSYSFVETIEEGEVLSWHYDYIKKLQQSDTKWLNFFRTELERVFYMLEYKEFRQYTLTSEERYLQFLQSTSEFAVRIPQHYIASYIGITPEALSRIRSRITASKKSKKS